uniref:G-protein coupled receptors family 1 profile domain-containing protein n=1 Tax=Anas platyrhynchos TaxID=8839 RepID=A0A8B9SS31_ANAPL
MTLDSLDVIYIMVEVVIGICAVVGNALVIWAVKLNPALQKTTFFYIVSLALTDIAVILGVVMHFYSCLFICCLLMIFPHASILSLLAITIDRYLRVKLVCVILGLCCTRMAPATSVCHFLAVMRKDYVVYFSFFTWILLPSLIMCTLYAKIFHIMRTKLSQNSARLPDGGTVYPKAYKTAKYMALLLFLFAVSWLPLGILNCVLHFCPSCTIPRSLVYLSILLSHANSAMNPAVYAFKIEKFKETCTFILRTYFLFQNSELDPASGGGSAGVAQPENTTDPAPRGSSPLLVES